MAAEPGCVERVFRGDDVLFDRVSGVRHLGSDAPITTHTAFRLASVSKQFTAAAILTLVEIRAVVLGCASWPNCCRECPAYTRSITVRQVLEPYQWLARLRSADGGGCGPRWDGVYPDALDRRCRGPSIVGGNAGTTVWARKSLGLQQFRLCGAWPDCGGGVR
jgi:hypothetical protein